MKLPSLLLRVLLCLSLIANGVGSAQAAVRMQLEHAGQVSSAERPLRVAPTVAASDVAPCHRQADAVPVPSASNDARGIPAHDMAPHDAGSKPAGTSSPDSCCKGNTCTCACAHASCAALAAMLVHAFPQPATRVPTFAVDHPQPRLPHLIRPPIG